MNPSRNTTLSSMNIALRLGLVVGIALLGVGLFLRAFAPAAAAPEAPEAALLFEPVYLEITTESADAARIGDLDGDGDLEIIIGRDDKISVYRNAGNGSFARADYSYGALSLALGDVDGDGDLDIAVGGYSTDILLLNDGAGEFRTTRSFGSSSSDTYGLALGDMDGDGDLDLVAGNDGSTTDQSTVYRNDGLGNFFAGAVNCGDPVNMRCFGGATDIVASVAVADMDRDNDLDIVAGKQGEQSAVYLNDGAGNFFTGVLNCGITPNAVCFGGSTDHSGALAVGDVDNDGYPDIVTGAGYYAYTNDFDQVHINLGSSFASNFFDVNYTMSATLGDLDGDGDLDVALGRYDDTTIVYWNDGTGFFTSADSLTIGSSLRTYLALGDLDGDGDVDIAQANRGYPSFVLRNNGGGNLGTTQAVGVTTNNIRSLTTGDMDNDSDVDVVISNDGQQDAVFLNNGAGVFPTGAFTCATPNVRCFGAASSQTQEVAVGDLNGDRALDIVAGRRNQQSAAYLNDGAGNFATTRNFGPASGFTTTVALGDLDGDGDLDIVAGNFQGQSRIYLNDGNANFGTSRNFGPTSDYVSSVAVGDVDGDGDADIVVGNEDEYLGQDILNVIYLNDGAGNFPLSRSFGQAQGTTELIGQVALGDVDGDGDLDIVTANNFLGQSLLYLNDGAGNFNWQGSARPYTQPKTTYTIALGDVDGDGDLDIATGQFEVVSLALNDGAGNFSAGRQDNQTSIWRDNTRSLALGDVNGDGRLDLIAGRAPSGLVANPPSQVYIFNRTVTALNQPPAARGLRVGPLQNGNFNYTNPSVRAATVPITYTLFDPEGNRASVRAFYSLDGGGQWYPAVAAAGTLTTNLPTTATYTYNWDVFASGFFGVSDEVVFRLEVFPYPTLANAFSVDGTYRYTNTVAGLAQLPYRVAQTPRFRVRGTQLKVVQGAAPVAGAMVYRLPVGQIDGAEPFADGSGFPFRTDALGFLQGRGQLQAGDGLAALLPTSGSTEDVYYSLDPVLPIPDADAVTSTLTITSGGVIQDLDVVDLYGTHTWVSDLRFTLRSPAGTQVEVLVHPCGSEDDFYLSLDDEADTGVLPCPPIDGGAYIPTNPLSAFDGENSTGTWSLIVNDDYAADSGTLEAWGLDITSGGADTVYYTSAAPNPTGLTLTPATASGVQTLTVSSANPLILFDLKVSLEWDARRDPAFINKLTENLELTSEFLYDWTNGRVALGTVTVYHDRENWNTAQVRIYGTNGLHPNADQGGVTTDVITETVVSNLTPITRTLTYAPGQVRMAAVWSRFGGGSTLGDDWPRTLAHELGHYLLFLDDAYLGMDANNNFIPLSSCAGTAMSDPYRDDYSEFIFDTTYWNSTACNLTLGARTTNRTEWATLRNFYPDVPAPSANVGPSVLPLAVTNIFFKDPSAPAAALEVPIFYLSYNNARAIPNAEARAILFQTSRNRLVDLGHPTDDRVTAFGAEAGDRLCVYDPVLRREGCENITASDTQLTLEDRSTWQPDIVILPVTSRTVNVQVSNLSSGLALQMQVYPQNDTASSVANFTYSGGVYSATVTVANPTTAAYVHIWVNEAEPRRESFSDYSLGGNPAPPRRKAPKRAPVTSNNGEVTLYNDLQLTDFAPGEFFALQPATRLNNVPAWLSVVGKGYRLLKSTNAPSLVGTALAFSYDLGDVSPGEEAFLQVYQYDANLNNWIPLTTTVSTQGKFALATVPGAGLYALMSSTNIPLYGPGWNLFAYPVQATRPVTEALLSISGYYTTVYGYVFTDTIDPWRIYDIGLPAQLNDLAVLEFGQGYWINVSADIILRLKGSGSTLAAPEALESFGSPPSTYYGEVFGDGTFTPAPGMVVQAYVNGNPCGQGVTQMVGSQLMYIVKTWAEGPGSSNGCGAPNRAVTFTVDGQSMGQLAAWNNSLVHLLNLTPGEITQVYLPVLRR